MNDVTKRVGVALFTVALCTACVTAPKQSQKQAQPPAVASWETSLDVGHGLVGKIWSSDTQRYVKSDQLLDAVAAHDLVLIGERHDHPDHHRLQALILQRVGDSALVGFEMLDENDAPKISAGMTADEIAQASDWSNSGWPRFEIYRPIFDVVERRKMTPLAIHPSRNRLMGRARQPQKFAEENANYLAKLPQHGVANLRVDIDRGHCGNAAGAMIDMMVAAQIYKDHWMASQMMAAEERRVAEGTSPLRSVIIAGNGHVRRDYGLPNHLPRQALSIGLIEVQSEQLSPADYDLGRFDYVWFTPRLDDEDPCEKYKKALEKMKEKYRKMRLKERDVSMGGASPTGGEKCQGVASKKSMMSGYKPPSVERGMLCSEPETP